MTSSCSTAFDSIYGPRAVAPLAWKRTNELVGERQGRQQEAQHRNTELSRRAGIVISTAAAKGEPNEESTTVKAMIPTVSIASSMVVRRIPSVTTLLQHSAHSTRTAPPVIADAAFWPTVLHPLPPASPPTRPGARCHRFGANPAPSCLRSALMQRLACEVFSGPSATCHLLPMPVRCPCSPMPRYPCSCRPSSVPRSRSLRAGRPWTSTTRLIR